MPFSNIYNQEIDDTKLTVVRASMPSVRFAQIAQVLALHAWRDDLPSRTEAELRHIYNPDLPNFAIRLYDDMRNTKGLFMGVMALRGSSPIGYAWAADLDSLSDSEKRKRNFDGKYMQPYPNVQEINVLPGYQNQGVGSLMLREVMSRFNTHRVPMTLVLDEQTHALEWFKQRGFALDPEDAPVERYNHFGPATNPSELWRMEGVGVVRHVRETLNFRQNVKNNGWPAHQIIDTNFYRDPFPVDPAFWVT